MRFVTWCLLLATLLVGCITDPNAGTAFSGNTPRQACSTGTEVVLVNPAPGSEVRSGARSIEIASNGAIMFSAAALALKSGRSSSGSHQLYGPVGPTPTPTPAPIPTPTPQPTGPIPFPSPAFYEARGFRLDAHKAYAVEITSVKATCHPNPIAGATFTTGARSSLVQAGVK
jgi:hypothetical protein